MNRGHTLLIRDDNRRLGFWAQNPPAPLFMPPQRFALPRHPTLAFAHSPARRACSVQ
jgi:hypothetical protein